MFYLKVLMKILYLSRTQYKNKHNPEFQKKLKHKIRIIMARQKGHIKYVGTLGEVRHFKIKGNEGKVNYNQILYKSFYIITLTIVLTHIPPSLASNFLPHQKDFPHPPSFLASGECDNEKWSDRLSHLH